MGLGDGGALRRTQRFDLIYFLSETHFMSDSFLCCALIMPDALFLFDSPFFCDTFLGAKMQLWSAIGVYTWRVVLLVYWTLWE